MLIQVKALRYWKSEHRDIQGCQDALNYEVPRGLFAVADGAGTTLFPAIWARILTERFVELPLFQSQFPSLSARPRAAAAISSCHHCKRCGSEVAAGPGWGDGRPLGSF